MVKVKICGMTNADNMREIAALKPDYFGLIFYPKSPRCVAPLKAAELPQFEGIKRVGVFVNETAGNTLQIAEQTKLALVQLHGNESPEFCEFLKLNGVEVIKVFSIDENFDGSVLKNYAAVCDYFLFDTKTPQHGGSGREFDWQILRRFEITKPFFLSGGISAENIIQAIESCAELPLHALDLNSRVEISAGLKSSAKILKVMQKINLEIYLAENAPPEKIKILGTGIADYTQSKTGGGKHTNLTFFVRDEAGLIVGGVHGNYSDFGWLYVDSLWVSESLRGGGYGTRLMNSIEREASKHGCHSVYLSTFSFQAPEFYKKLGYTVFGELPDYPPENSRLFLTKKLV